MLRNAIAGEEAHRLREMPVLEFVRRIKAVGESGARYAWFLGAGCSISSGIPGAGALVRDVWMPRLKQHRTGDRDGSEHWGATEFEGYALETCGGFYGRVIEDLFTSAAERQGEIERITSGHDPGFGYGVLAQLLSHPTYSSYFRVVLTTNFDDMVSDALFVYTNKKPLVIVHETLIRFVRVLGSQPVVIKLHGDARLTPMNTTIETSSLDNAVRRVLANLLGEMGLIFTGYGGNDVSIAAALETTTPPWGVYWVNESRPDNALDSWLERVGGIWVRHTDFDELMVLLWSELGFEHPARERFDTVFRGYFERFSELRTKFLSKPTQDQQPIIEAALEEAAQRFGDWYSAYLEASKYEETDPDRAETLYEEGLEAFPTSAELIGSYALFQSDVKKDSKRADKLYRRAIDADPSYAINLGNYALFLSEVLHDSDRADEYFRRAIEADPSDATSLGNFADFLADVRDDADGADASYRQAIEADPSDAGTLGSYAVFLSDVRLESDRADVFYERAVEADPTHARNLGNYAVFLSDVRHDSARAEEFYERAVEADPGDAVNLGNFALFLYDVRHESNKAEGFFRRAIEADPGHANTLGNYALFLSDVRHDPKRADEYYRRAIEADPTDANNLSNYTRFLLATRGWGGGRRMLERAFAANPDPITRLECAFYGYAHAPSSKRAGYLSMCRDSIDQGVRSPRWDLTANVDRAILDGHPAPDLVEELASVIAGYDDAAELRRFPGWASRE